MLRQDRVFPWDWKNYRHRFLPWLLLNWRKNAKKSPKAHSSEYDHNLKQSMLETLTMVCEKLDTKFKECYGVNFSQEHMKSSWTGDTEKYNLVSRKKVLKVLGYSLLKRLSTIPGAGLGVFVDEGRIQHNDLVAIYPGLIYMPGDPLFFQSLANQFVFRCQDGIHVDGNDRALSKVLYRSCAGRETVGSHLMCDISWLTQFPINPLCIGQFINNSTKEKPANVEYVELNLPSNFKPELLKYIPSLQYTSTCNRERRVVVLRSLRDIEQGEELFSTYFTVLT